MSERVTVLALTYGEPPAATFGAQYRYSLLILQRLTRKVAPLPRFALPLIALLRGRRRVREWKAAEYGSPLEAITEGQVEALRESLKRHDPSREYDVRTVYEFREPLLPEVLRCIHADPPDQLLLLPLYVGDSSFTRGISEDDLARYEQRHGEAFQPAPRYVAAFSEDDRLAELYARFVIEWVAERGFDDAALRETALILGAHGTLVHSPKEGIDTGYGTMQCFYQRLADRLRDRFAYLSVGWLNHRVGGEWTQPDLDSAIADMHAQGLRKAIYFPFGFFADNAETQLEGRAAFEPYADVEVTPLPCVNTWQPFIDYLALRVTEALADNGALHHDKT